MISHAAPGIPKRRCPCRSCAIAQLRNYRARLMRSRVAVEGRVEGRVFTFDIHAESELDTHVILSKQSRQSHAVRLLVGSCRAIRDSRRAFAQKIFSSRALKDLAAVLLDVRYFLTRPLGFPNDAVACRICAIAQIRNYRARLMCGGSWV